MCLTLPERETIIEASRTRADEDAEGWHREWLAINAARPVPYPVCKTCDCPFPPKDGHPLLDRTCECCGGPIVEELMLDFIFAKGRKAKKKAARRLRALAK